MNHNPEYFALPDKNIYIINSSNASKEKQVSNTAHEGYGHAYFYELNQKGNSVNPFHEYKQMYVPGVFDVRNYESRRIDLNINLANQIRAVIREANKNYKLGK